MIDNGGLRTCIFHGHDWSASDVCPRCGEWRVPIAGPVKSLRLDLGRERCAYTMLAGSRPVQCGHTALLGCSFCAAHLPGADENFERESGDYFQDEGRWEAPPTAETYGGMTEWIRLRTARLLDALRRRKGEE